MPTPAVASPPADAAARIRTLIVDDSVVVRSLYSRWLKEHDDVDVVGVCRNGKVAVESLDRFDPHVVLLDIEMPEMDGLTALPEILRKKPGIAVIMASTLTRRNAEMTLKALGAGARDYIPKPDGTSGLNDSPEFRRELVEKVLTFGAKALSRSVDTGAISARSSGEKAPLPPKMREPLAQTRAKGGILTMRRFTGIKPRILAIGASTGGPQALMEFFADAAPALSGIPVVLTQHMPRNFTGIFAEHIERASGLEAREGQAGEPLRPGVVYVAPGGHHMVIAKVGDTPFIEINSDPPVNFCRPAVDPLFDSVARVYGSASLALVFTGMGNDGAAGAVSIADAGGNVIAQDEETSVVWGMPGATANAGATFAVLPLSAIAAKVSGIVGRTVG